MDNKPIVENIRGFLEQEKNCGKNLSSYQSLLIHNNSIPASNIKIGLKKYKDIILEDETGLELGGVNRKSFSIVIPLKISNLINHGIITLLGREVDKITESSIDFGIIILVELLKNAQINEDEVRQMNFISNGIEGFSIRTIPRRFWCRISKSALQKGFSFEFLGTAIISLYKQKYLEKIRAIEVIFINSYLSSIDQIVTLTADISNKHKEKWKKKIDEWRKRIDCDYDWGCDICPYREECYDIKQVLISREEL